MKKGFTLIEMIVVILLIGIISLIAVPLYNTIIDNGKESSFKGSMVSIIHEIENYVIANPDFDYSEEIEIAAINLNISGKEKYGSGSFYRDGDYIILVDVSDGEYCANGNKNDLEVKKGNCH